MATITSTHFKFSIILIFIFLTSKSYGEDNLKKHLFKVDRSGLTGILEKKYLRVLTTKNPYDYYMFQGKMKGLQYEMVREFVDYLNSKYVKNEKLKIAFELIPVDFDELIPLLSEGRADFIAVGMTETAGREKYLAFTNPYHNVDDVIVTRKELKEFPWRQGVFHVQENSSYLKVLRGSKDKINVKTVDANFNASDLMQFVSIGKFDYTLINSYWADTIGKRFDNLYIHKETPFRKSVPISWATRKENKGLLDELNLFLPKIKKGSYLGNLLNYKYFHDLGRIETVHFNLDKSQISKYDEYFKKYGKKFNIDWRLLAALCYQESRFNQDIINRWGAIGLFQIKQMTANEPYVAIPNISGQKNFENNIHAGVKYLSWIKKRYFDPKEEMSEDTRLRMMMAAYNAGPRRVLQAINKTKSMGLDTNKWFRNVELGMLELGYPEPVIYVSEINKYFVSYDLLGINE